MCGIAGEVGTGSRWIADALDRMRHRGPDGSAVVQGKSATFGCVRLAIRGGEAGDQPLAKDPARADCPGLIECPLTGELICADECPLANDAAKGADLPPCCKNKK